MTALQDQLEASNDRLWRMTPEARLQLRGQLANRLRARDGCVLVVEHEQKRPGLITLPVEGIQRNIRYDVRHISLMSLPFSHLDEVGIVIFPLARKNIPIIETGGVALEVPLAYKQRLLPGRLKKIGECML